MKITSQSDWTSLATLNQNYASSLKKQKNTQSIATNQTIAATEENKGTTIVQQEQLDNMQAHFGLLGQSGMNSTSIQVPDIRKLTDRLQQEFSTNKVVSDDKEATTARDASTTENNSMSSEELMDSFLETYSKKYEKYLTAFTQ